MRKFARMLALAGGVSLAAAAAATPAAAFGLNLGFGTLDYCDTYNGYSSYDCPNYGLYDHGPYWGWRGHNFGHHFAGHTGHIGGHFSGHGHHR